MKAKSTNSGAKGKRTTSTDSEKNIAKTVKASSKVNAEAKKEAAPMNETPIVSAEAKKETASVKDDKKVSAETKKETSLVKETKKEVALMKEAVKASVEKVKEAVEAKKKDIAIKTDAFSYLYARENTAYNFGTGDFTVEAWVKTKQAGTVIARKGDAGGYNNGGFLLVLKEDGSIKFATDDGTGFYEVVSDKKNVLDNKWHHILGVRQDGKMRIYLDFVKLGKTAQTNRFTPLDVNNSNNLTVAFTEQQGEVYQHLEGQLTDVRIWNIAKIYDSKVKYDALKLEGNENGLVGWWNFRKKDGSDFSDTKNMLEASGDIEYVEKK